MKSSICRLITTISLIIMTVGVSQAHDMTRSVISRLSIQEGLTQGEVTTTLIDSDGFLWIGTAEGLNRFDGYEVKTVGGPNNILRFSYIYSLMQDQQGNLWISSSPGGLIRLNLSTNEYEQILKTNVRKEFELGQSFSSINQDKHGIIWITYGQRLLRFDPTTKMISEPYSLEHVLTPNQSITAAASLGEHLYIGTDIGLYVLEISSGTLKELKFTEQKPVLSTQVSTIFIDSEEHIWIGTKDGIFAVTPSDVDALISHNKPVPLKIWQLSVKVFSIAEKERSIIIGTEDGLFELKSIHGKSTPILRFSDSVFQLADNTIRDITPDRFGNYWLASVTEGTYLWSPQTDAFDVVYKTNNFSTQVKPINYSKRSTEPNQIIWGFAQASKDIVWVGSNNGLNEYNLKTRSQVAYLKEHRVDGLVISKIIPTAGNLLWLETTSGLKLFNTQTKQEVDVPLADETQLPFINSEVWSLFQFSENELWFFNDIGMFIYNNESGTIRQNTELEQHLPLSYQSVVLGRIPSAPHKLVIGTEGHAWIFDTKTNSSEAIISPSITGTLTHSPPTAIYFDNNGTLWIAFATSGLYGLDAQTYQLKKHYNESNGLSSDTVFSLLPDEEGNIWISSHAGLMKLHIKSGFIQTFSVQDGLLTPEFNQGASLKLEDGRLVFGSIKGLTILNPSYFANQESTPFSVYITDVRLMSRSLNQSLGHHNNQFIELDYDDIGLTISFSTLFLSHQHQTYYDYALIGDETLDYPRNKDHSLTIPQLAPGEYVFEVQALSPFSGSYSSKAKLSIKVNHAPWSSPLAISGYIILCLMLFTIWIHRRNIQQRGLLTAHNELKESEERLQLALRCNRSGVWEWDANTNLIFEPRIHDDLQRTDFHKNIPYEGHLSLIHPIDKANFVHQWHNLLSGAHDHLDCNYRLMNKEGKWLWYRDVGKVVIREANKRPLKISGTYTNITDAEVNRTEALLFGEAFQKTHDAVIILDENRNPIAANESFYQLVQSSPNQLEANIWDTLRWSQSKRAHYVNIVEKLKENEHWQGEEVFHSSNNKTIPVFIKISTFRSPNASSFSYVVVITDITRQKDAEAKLKRLANYDSLTQLPNRNLLTDRIKHAIDRAKRVNDTIAIFFLDLDRFKQINDSLGHDAGDTLLSNVAQRLVSVLRTDDTVARLGGDEFVILLESYRSTEHISAIAKKVINTIDQPLMLNGQVVSVSTSIGIAIYPNDAANTIDLLKHADLAMYHAKDNGRNNFQFYAESMNEKAKLRLVKESQLKQALLNKEFVNFYQPIVDAKTHKIVGFELLMRWFSKDGMISPMEFIPLAEEIGLITKMTIEAMRSGLRDLDAWHNINSDLYLSINLSPRHIDDPQLLSDIDAALSINQTSAKHLRFEITESALMRDKNKALRVLEDLKQKGYQLALDDFGTGYSSLLYLKMFPIDIIKIDRSFVKDIGIDHNDEVLISTIMAMTDALGKYCIAEGVETHQQREFLSNLKCEYLQGYLFSKPVPADDIIDMLAAEQTVQQR